MSAIVDTFARLARDGPDGPVIHALTEERTVTASGVFDAYLTLKHELAEAGLGPGAVIISAAGNRAAFIPLVLASFDLRSVLMPIDRTMPTAEVEALADTYGAAALAVQSGVPIERAHQRTRLGGGLDLAYLDAQPDRGRYGDAVLLKLTSGTTGLPKAALAAERHLIADVTHIVRAMDIRPGDVQLGIIPLSHMYGFGNLVLPLLMQGTAMTLRESFMPVLVPSDIAGFGTRIFHGVPFMFDALAALIANVGLPPALEVVVSAGARLEHATLERFHAAFGLKVHSFYGTTETGGITYDATPDLDPSVPVGTPIGDVRLRFAPVYDGPVEGGRVHVTSSAVSTGYAGHHEDTAGFIDGGYLTGDVGRLDARGQLILTGRVSSFVNVAGRKVQPEEVEGVLRGMPGITDACVLGMADRQRGEQLVACVVRADTTLGPAAVRRYLVARLTPYKIPRVVRFVESLPRTDRGKIDRRAIEALVVAALEGDRVEH
jgi:long-chain acyl-CoA synthetase